ncbi:hypothetical protein ACHQM5_024965 [Ranunculus cassubicifolius]
MSCNGCRVLRKGCSESCILRPCLQWIESPEAQGHATVFVAKFFGRAGLMSFISGVPESQRPALFQSLLFEACGRTVNPVNGAVGLLWTGNWHVCQTAVETVLRGGTLQAMTEVIGGGMMPESDEVSEVQDPGYFRSKGMKRKGMTPNTSNNNRVHTDLQLSLSSGCSPKKISKTVQLEKQRSTTPSMYSEDSVTTSFDSGCGGGGVFRRDRNSCGDEQKQLLNLFL